MYFFLDLAIQKNKIDWLLQSDYQVNIFEAFGTYISFMSNPICWRQKMTIPFLST